MKLIVQRFISCSVIVFVGIILPSMPAQCAAKLWGIQPATNQIVVVDPVTGNVVSGFAPPGSALVPTQTFGGLTIAEGGNVLLYQNPVAHPTSLFRINPSTGALLSTEFMPPASSSPEFRAGLSYQTGAGVLGQNAIFAINDGGPLQRQDGYNNPVLIDHTPPTASDAGAVGGDDTGRLFLAVNNPTANIVEFSPFVANAIIRSYAQPLASVRVGGMAFDGESLYLSYLNSRLYTLDPNTGAVIRTVLVQGGPLIGLGAYIPEPATMSTAAFGVWCVIAVGWRRRRRSRM
jgi:hypothetical protein